jgi:hypothetical protein
MKLHAKHQRFCLLPPPDLNDLAGAEAEADAVAIATALAVLFLFLVPSLRPSPIPDPLLDAIVGRTASGATS